MKTIQNLLLLPSSHHLSYTEHVFILCRNYVCESQIRGFSPYFSVPGGEDLHSQRKKLKMQLFNTIPHFLSLSLCRNEQTFASLQKGSLYPFTWTFFSLFFFLPPIHAVDCELWDFGQCCHHFPSCHTLSQPGPHGPALPAPTLAPLAEECRTYSFLQSRKGFPSIL